jgi:hypothetical protein
LKSHVVSSKQRKAASSSNQNPSLFSRLSSVFSGATGQAPPESGASAAVDGRPPAVKSKRGYGFATSNVAHYDDKHSEDLYRFKNLSSDYMRQPSPTREEDQPAGASGTGSYIVKEPDSDSDDENDKASSKYPQRSNK